MNKNDLLKRTLQTDVGGGIPQSHETTDRNSQDGSPEDPGFTENNDPVTSPKMILLADDGDITRDSTKNILTNFGYVVDSVHNAEQALAMFDPRLHDLVLTDNSMPGMSGAEMAHVIKLRSPSTPVLMYTGRPPEDQSCVDLVIQRPTHLLKLKEAVDRLLSQASGLTPSAQPV